MANLKQIKRRIGSVRSTQQITKAMKMVAAAKLRRAQESIQLARPYALRLQEALARVAAGPEAALHPLLEPRIVEQPTVCYLVVTADRGLCGSFNAAVIKRVQQALAEAPGGQRSVLYCVGKKGYDFFKRRATPIVGHRIGFFNHLDFSDALSIGADLRRLYGTGEVDRVQLVFNEFKSAIQQILHSDTLLPVQLEDGGGSRGEEIFEPDARQLLDQLLPMFVHRIIWRVLLDSYAAEQGARMTAMESATDNAAEMIADLTLQYNRTRQAAITQEIAEIVGGAAAIQ
jgi:F-type H+-transporting ATPase subunit gamma